MQFISYRELHNDVPSVLHELTNEGAFVITMDNKSFAAMINLDEEEVH